MENDESRDSGKPFVDMNHFPVASFRQSRSIPLAQPFETRAADETLIY